MKIYLVSSIYCYSDEKMSKDFITFATFGEAKAYKEEFIRYKITDLMEYYEVDEEDELYNIIEITSDNDWVWGYLSPDCTTEYELEITELDLMSWKEN